MLMDSEKDRFMPTHVKSPCDEGVVRAALDVKRQAPNIGRWVLLATILGSSMAFIDGSVVNVALPVIQVDLNATATDVQWVVEAYLLFLGALILVGGSLGDHYGRRRVFAIGIAIFIVSSIWCGLAPDLLALIIGRAIQGVGGALLVPGSLAIISASFGEEQRGRAFGTWSAFTSVTSVVGPVLGGVLVQYATWRWVFFLNVPLAVVVLIVLFWRVPESRDESAQGTLDWWGAALTTAGLAAIVFGLIQAGSLGFTSPQVIAFIAIGIVILLVFLFIESRISFPMVSLALFRSSTFSGANLLTFLLYGALSALTYFFPFDLIQVQGYSPTVTGAAFVPFIVIMFALSRLIGGFADRFGARPMLIIGPTITAIGFAFFALPGTSGSYWLTFFPAVVVMGIGMTITVSPLTTAVMGAVASNHAGIASAINNAVSRIAGLFAIAILSIVMVAVFSNSLVQQLATLPLSPALRQSIDAQRFRLAGIAIPSTANSASHAAIKAAIDSAFVSGFRVVTFICAALALLSALAAWALVRGKKASQSEQAPIAENG
jgi:EmrB/QacA subfamily drug resistance transporter